ncbi:MAG: sensor domain-containing diguanylate cyclase [Candidatus Gastranaerophilales bacterium]|nr:sensor domain-containing diguanylate cyclase [Candidatus Gastranaerophilales bacterium]
MNIKDSFLIYKIFNTICTNNNVENLGEDLKLAFSEYYELSEINILYYDEQIKKLKNVLKDFELAQDYYSEEKMSTLKEIFEELKTSEFILNDDCSLPEDIFDDGNVIAKTISIPLKYEDKCIGLFRMKFKNKIDVSTDDLKFLEIFSYNLSLKVQNIVLAKQLEVNSAFYKSMKDIAKIIETQYDFQYIIPLIGEMIDKFVMNHLIYVFVKQEDKFNLFWPGACWNKKVYELIEDLNNESDIKISEDKKTGVFPLMSEDNVLGCIVAHSTIDKLTDNEINYITELTNQSATTIERANVYSEILQNATMDALTGLNNRRQFELRLKEEYSSANRQNTPLCAIMIDIDYFKKFNDTYGHAVGDTVLRTTASVIKDQLREYDIPSRYGGEEFCVLLPQTGIEEARIVAERLRAAVENKKIEIKSEKDEQIKNISVTISVGLAELDVRDMADDLYMKADRALYQAKENGRNRVVVYEK